VDADAPASARIPGRVETLKVLRLMGDYRPLLMLRGDADGYGTRWTIDGQQVEPAIATYLMKSGYIVDSGATEMGARKLTLTEAGIRFRSDGLAWWAGLGLLEKLKIAVFG
jgi:predicted alpha/beta-hydrolase family hydrolase